MIDRAVMLFPHLIDTFGVDMTFSSFPLGFTFHLLMSSSIPAVLIFFCYVFSFHSSPVVSFAFFCFSVVLYVCCKALTFLKFFINKAFETEQFEHKREIIEFDRF